MLVPRRDPIHMGGMKSAVPKTMLGFVALFGVLVAVTLVAQIVWWDPGERPEERKGTSAGSSTTPRLRDLRSGCRPSPAARQAT